MSEELQRAVKRLKEDLLFAHETAKKHGGTADRSMFSVSDIRLLLSERAELLATVGKLRLELVTAGMHIETSPGAYEDRAKRIVQNIRAALTTGEDTAGSPIGQNDQRGLAFSDAGEP